MFDPENEGWVRQEEYDALLEKYSLLLSAEPARVAPFKNGYWVFAKDYSFFTAHPENGQAK